MIETSHKKLPKTRKDFGNINKVSDKQRIEFAKTFGVKSLKVRRQRIRQIRFKPGYLRFFRRLRNDYKKTNSISLKYQWRLTTYLKKFKEFNNSVLLRYSVFSLRFLLLTAHIFSNTAEADYMIKNNIIFINGLSCKIINFQVQSGDYLQIRVSYHMYKYLLYQTLKKKQILSYGFSLLRQHASVRFLGRQRFPRNKRRFAYKIYNKFGIGRLLRLYYILFDIPRYLELDFLTLSIYIIIIPNNIQDFDYIAIRRSAITYVKMLNWKYIN